MAIKSLGPRFCPERTGTLRDVTRRTALFLTGVRRQHRVFHAFSLLIIRRARVHKKERLTFIEAASIVAGYGIGSGIMAVPYLASKTGIVPFLILMCAAFFVSILIHLMVAEIMLRDSSSNQMIELYAKYLFRGKIGQILLWVFFVLIIIAFLTSLAAYIAEGGEILTGLFGIPLWIGHVVTYGIAAGIVFFGLKAIGLSEKYAILGIVALVATLSIRSLWLPYTTIVFGSGGANAWMALFGMIMFSFFALFSVPQAVEGLAWNKKLIPRAIIAGMLINFIIILVITLMAMGVSQEVTRVGIVGWGKSLGFGYAVSGGLFVILAALTSYWSVSFALSTILQERLKLGDKISWLVATLPTFIIVITRFSDFLGFMRIAGGAIALLVAILTVPLLRSIRKHGNVKNPEWSLGYLGGGFFQLLVVLGFLLMAVGSVVKI